MLRGGFACRFGVSGGLVVCLWVLGLIDFGVWVEVGLVGVRVIYWLIVPIWLYFGGIWACLILVSYGACGCLLLGLGGWFWI